MECNNCNISAHTYIGSFIRFMNRLIEKRVEIQSILGQFLRGLLKNLHVKQLEDQPLLEDFPLAVKTLTSYLSNLLILIFLVHHQIPNHHIEQAKNGVMDIQSHATKKHLQFFDLQ